LNYILDTHVWLWAASRPDKLGAHTTGLLLDETNSLYVSAISSLEVAQLSWAGKILLPMKAPEWIKASVAQLNLTQIPLSSDIAAAAYSLAEPIHKDPADRILVATALHHGLVLLTADKKLLDYTSVKTVDCGE